MFGKEAWIMLVFAVLPIVVGIAAAVLYFR